mmetsp:Transcript_41547/g.118842  ORF Transcript_41547/g.118842 Transcript_41547/m.118842 type:complete len:83 (+) Transcript_41547:197-445(+)
MWPSNTPRYHATTTSSAELTAQARSIVVKVEVVAACVVVVELVVVVALNRVGMVAVALAERASIKATRVVAGAKATGAIVVV